jgi:hypothetical protein
MTAKILRLYDDTGWTCDVEVSAAMWDFYKRAARKRHMRIADWLEMAITDGAQSLLAKHAKKTA